MPVEKSPLSPNREDSMKELLYAVKGISAIENVLRNNLQVLSMGVAEQSAVESLRGSLEKGDNLGVLVAQSELTAVKLLSLQMRQRVEEEKLTTPDYEKAESKVLDILGNDAADLQALKEIVPEFLKRDDHMRW